MKLVIALTLALVLVVAPSSYALTVRGNMQVARVEDFIKIEGIVYEYKLLAQDCTGGWDSYIVYSQDVYKLGDWVVVTIDLCNTEDGLHIEDIVIVEPYHNN